MNNLNNPDDWNIRPEQQGDGGSSKWNYALLVPMLGLAAFSKYTTEVINGRLTRKRHFSCQLLNLLVVTDPSNDFFIQPENSF